MTKETSARSTILIVEDDTHLVKALEHKFTIEGFDVVIARDGAEGLSKAEEERPDLILLDLIMPVMDGVTMLKKLRINHWGRSVPVIVLSNLSEGKDVEEADKQEVYDYLVKSNWTLEDVVAKVRERLSKG